MKKTHEEKKKEAQKDLDYLRQIDVPENMGGGRKFVQEYEDDKKQKEQKRKDDIATDLQTKQHARFSYRRSIADYGQKLLDEADFGENWISTCLPTDGSRVNIYGKWFKSQEGVLVIVKSPKGNVYTRGIKTTNIPEYDMKAIEILAIQAENSVDKEKGLLLDKEIWTP